MAQLGVGACALSFFVPPNPQEPYPGQAPRRNHLIFLWNDLWDRFELCLIITLCCSAMKDPFDGGFG